MITSYKPEGTYRWFSFKVIQFLWGREETCPSCVHRHQRTALKLVEYTPYACTLGQGRGAKTPYVPENEAVPPNHTAPWAGAKHWTPPVAHGTRPGAHGWPREQNHSSTAGAQLLDKFYRRGLRWGKTSGGSSWETARHGLRVTGTQEVGSPHAAYFFL